MPQASTNYNLSVLKPNLLKEWHPTKNAPIKPQDITPGSGKKIWWICRKGHEWQATFKSRIKGEGLRDDDGVVYNFGLGIQFI